MRAAPLALLALAAALCGGCAALQARVMASRATAGLEAIQSYRARTREQGLLRDAPGVAVVKEVLYQRPWRLRAEVVAPEEHAGQLACFDGSTLTLWWPAYYFGVRVRGIRLPREEEVGDLVLADCAWLLERYVYEYLGPATHAGRPVVGWRATPRRPGGHLRPYYAWLDDVHQVPLRVEASEAGRTWYSVAFDPIEFDVPVAEGAFRFDFPPGAIVHDWDLGGPAVTLAAARARVEFPILLPRALPAGHRIERIVAASGDHFQMVGLLMPHGARWLSLTEVPDMGPILVPEVGIPVAVGEAEGVVNLAFGFTIVSWAQGTTALTLIGNLPYPEMLAIAESVGPAEEGR